MLKKLTSTKSPSSAASRTETRVAVEKAIAHARRQDGRWQPRRDEDGSQKTPKRAYNSN